MQMSRLLVVDDDPVVLSLVQIRLKTGGHRVISAADPNEAIKVVEERGVPDLAVLDVSMPGMSGLELLTLIALGVLSFGGLTYAERAVRDDAESRVTTAATAAAAYTGRQLTALEAAVDNAARRRLLVQAVGSGAPTRMDIAGVDDQL